MADHHLLGPDFPKSEIDRRVKLIQAGLQERGLTATLIVDHVNITYVTGYRTEWWKNPSRRRACWLPATGDPLMITVGGEARAVAALAYCDVIDAGGPSATATIVNGQGVINFETELAAAVVAAGHDLGVHGAERIGLPMGSCSRMEVPLSVLNTVQASLASKQWEDVWAVFSEARAVKSDFELAYLRQAVHTLDDAFAEIYRELEPGMNHLDLARVLRAKILLAGAENPGFTEAATDIRDLYEDSPDHDRVSRGLAEGSIAFLDGGGIVRGYWSDYDRLFVLGKPTDDQRRAYEAVARAHFAALDAIRPGVTASEVTRVILDELASEGYSTAPVGRMGHGNGLEMPEPPFLHVDDQTVLREGMVICVEPNTFVPGIGSLVLEDQIVVSATGAEHLSRAPTTPELMTL
ncbi:MAG TPA: Xaa-Pro peptidase family protein [Solirubrobacteraceae bacterium]|jgi:Xaa-Pro dipeptidase